MSSSPIRICLLTLEKHVADVWVVELQDRLQSAGPPPASVTTMSVESMALELDVGSRLPFDVMVNRVSDAATPRMVKAALTILRSAELDGLLVINGTQAYSVGMSKVLHHVALRKSGLAAPKTLMCGSPPPLPCEVTKQLRFPILLKPNSGGPALPPALLRPEVAVK